MGNFQECNDFERQFIEMPVIKSFKKVQTAPKIDYATKLNLKQFPPLLEHIQKQRKTLSNNSIVKSINKTPIYFLESLSAVYQGYWNNGLPHGEGRILYPDKSYYEGRIFNGELDTGQKSIQQGIYIFKNGSYYVGGFRNSKFQGKGKLVSFNGIYQDMIIEGQFKSGFPHGKCKQKFVQVLSGKQDKFEQTYYGNFQNGLKSGKGKYLIENNIIYEGQFNQGGVHGKGKHIDDQDDQWTGIFMKGTKQQGQLIFDQGIINQQRAGRKMKGIGIFQWKDKKFYIGQFLNQRLHGEGTLYFPQGSVIEGIWQDGHNIKIRKYYQLSPQQIKNKKSQFQLIQQQNSSANSLEQILRHQNQTNRMSRQYNVT